MSKTFKIARTSYRNSSVTVLSGTVEEITKACSYTLSCGASYSHEKGNRKINQNPKTITSLISNLNNAVNNSAANGYAGVTYAMAAE